VELATRLVERRSTAPVSTSADLTGTRPDRRN
jgi:hypothetical protein